MFKQIKSQEITNLNATFLEFEHSKTKAKHYHLKSADKNNGFLVLFKTLPYSDNGIMHILEHCVLSGSRDFDMANPFNSILKQSLQTFMNAMTDEDNTLFPFTTQNKKDYFNLMHVYTNAVFFPTLAKEIFMTEGWRYEFEEPENQNSDLKLNGVVYNEMLGRRSSPVTRIFDSIANTMYPDTVYKNISGGEPSAIPELSYEEFKEFHKQYYHPSNAIFVTYGDIDVAEIHKKLEEFALSEFDYKKIEMAGEVIQTPFKEVKNKTFEYPYAEEDYNENHYYTKVFHIFDKFNATDYVSAEFIRRILASDSSSVVTKALEKSGLTKDVECILHNSINNGFIAFVAEGVKLENIEKIDKIITNTLQEVIKKGVSEELINKELHQIELANRGMYNNVSNAAYYLLNSIVRFELADFNQPEVYLNPDKALEILKKQLKDKNFIGNFVKQNLLENTFSANITIKANPEKAKEESKKIEDLLANVKASLTDKDKQKIIAENKAVDKYKTKEFPGILPEFSTADIPADFNDFRNFETREYKGTTIHAYPLETNKMSYVSKSGYIEEFKASDLVYLGLYQMLFTNVGYGDKTYEQEDEYAYSICGGIHFNIKINEDRYNAEKVYIRTDLGTKMLHSNLNEVKQFMQDKLTKLRFDEKERIISYIERTNADTKTYLSRQATSIAIGMSASQLAPTHNILSYFNGIQFDLLINKLVKDLRNNDEKYNNLIAKFKEIHKKVLKSFEQSILLVVDEEEHLEKTIELFFDDSIVSNPKKVSLVNDLPYATASAFLSNDTSANYCAMAINAPYRDHELAGAYAVLATIIEAEFAHPTFREKGGAYGGWASYSPNNELFSLQTYMDPGLSQTFDTFKTVKNWLQETEFTDKQLEEGILQIIAKFDNLTSKISKCIRATERYLDDVKDEEITEFRAKILATTHEQMQRVINELILPNLNSAVFTTFANKQQFEKEGLKLKTLSFS